MLDEQQSSQIVVDCIRAVSHVPDVDLNGTLDDAGIVNTARVNNMVTLIVNSTSIGVPSLQHRISANFFLGVGTSTVVDEVIGIVMDKSFPAPQHNTEEFALLVAEHLTSRFGPKVGRRGKASKKGAAGSKGGTKKSGKKAAKKISK